MNESAKNANFEQLARRIQPQARLLRVWPLSGGISAQVTAFEIVLPDGRHRKLILRQHGAADRQQNPRIAADEFRLLEILQAAGIAAPAPCLVDDSGAIFPTPVIVQEYLEGAPEFAPANLSDYVQQAAAALAAIHRVDPALHDLSFLPQQSAIEARRIAQQPQQLDDSLQEGRIRAALDKLWPPAQTSPALLLHGDYWPGNLLWQSGQLVGIIDWENAALGDPLSDLANTRMEMRWAFGAGAMQDFTRQYQLTMPQLDFASLPLWDLCAALRPASKLALWSEGNSACENTMRAAHRDFVAQALAAMPVS
jgi:aminoglycoside phosphotransferase (APT) family kinase protein